MFRIKYALDNESDDDEGDDLDFEDNDEDDNDVDGDDENDKRHLRVNIGAGVVQG